MLVNGWTNCGTSIQWSTAIKRNKLLIHTVTWKHHESIMLSESSQRQKATHCVIISMTFWKRKNVGIDQGWPELGVGEGDRLQRNTVRLCRWLKCFISWFMVAILQLHSFVKAYRAVYLKRVNVTKCELYQKSEFLKSRKKINAGRSYVQLYIW